MPDEPFPEVGRCVHLEHVNFELDDHDLATVFFMAGLGLTRDPYKRADDTNMGVNVGLQQFHLPRRGNPTPPFPGLVGLVVPDLDGACDRLARLQAAGKFDATPYTLDRAGDMARVTSPFGINMHLHAAGTLPFLRPLGLAYVDVPVPPGTAAGLVSFYRRIMGCPAELTDLDGVPAAVVGVGAHQSLRYRECTLGSYETHSFHVAIYTTDYNALRRTLKDQDAFMGDALNQTFFFNRLFDPDSGETLIHFQHEMRGLFHPDFMRPLVNRWPLDAEPFSDQASIMASLRERPGLSTSRNKEE